MPNNLIDTIEDPGGALIKVVEKVPNHWHRSLCIDIEGPSTGNDTLTTKLDIKIATPAHLASYIEQINAPDILDKFAGIENGELVHSFFETINLQPYNKLVGGLGAYLYSPAQGRTKGRISGSLGSTYFINVSLDAPFQTIRSLSEVLESYI